MKILYSSNHHSHVPEFEIFNGHPDAHAEIPSRIENIRKCLIKNSFKINNLIKKTPISLILKTHQKDYVDYLKKGSSFLYPSVFPYNNLNQEKQLTNDLANHGKYSFDLYTPMLKNIYKIAHESSSLAYELSNDILNKKIKIGYALCRPPGHHAERAKMGGYCYFNNSAIAAQYLSTSGKVAVLDVDFHHGNGTQNIFYDRADVLTISIHADPNWKFPYYTGFANEIGFNEGEGKNINFPLSSVGLLKKKSSSSLSNISFISLASPFKAMAERPSWLILLCKASTAARDTSMAIIFSMAFSLFKASAMSRVGPFAGPISTHAGPLP